MKLQITIDGKQYEADIEVLEEERSDSARNRAPNRPPPTRAVSPSTPPPAPASAAVKPAAVPSATGTERVCKSSIVGIVFKVLATPGKTVAVGETLLILEAMKMESNVVSPLAGKVKSVLVVPGDSVKKGQVLVEFE